MSDLSPGTPLLIVISSPSGGGKSTLCRRLIAGDTALKYSISCTTRAPRGHERDGVDYHFLSVSAFKEARSRGEFLESAEVHGHYYGTLEAPVRKALLEGQGIIMAIDVQGASQIRSRVGQLGDQDLLRVSYLDIFILPPSIEVLAQRLRSRGEDPEDVIQRRLRNAEMELRESDHYQHRVVNEDLDLAYQQLRLIIASERRRRAGL